uniref:Complement factor B n=1 Tax=Sphenodon punctatus TaxID=8508 RepID=A0A8D0H534_SPHPU
FSPCACRLVGLVSPLALGTYILSVVFMFLTLPCSPKLPPDGASRPKATCDPKTGEISGGSYKVLKDGSVLMYECPEGKYPYPVPIQTRGGEPRESGTWGETRFEHGDFEPRQPRYNVSQELRFHCYGGYTLRGSHNRTCLPNGKWSGETAVCDDGAGHCPNPGAPIGAWKEGTQYWIEDSVRYHCHQGLALVGSAKRTCLESGEWSGSEPACRGEVFGGCRKVIEKVVATTGKRRIKIEPGGSMNIYVVLDASESIGKDFEKAQNVIIKLIEKVASYDVSPKYGIVTYATEAKEVVKATDVNSNDAAWVIDQLKNITYKDHQLKPGTNTKAGLDKVYHQMLLEQEEEKRRGEKYPRVSNTTRHVIILMTDGENPGVLAPSRPLL